MSSRNPLPGGATAVYDSSGLRYYRHPDWLGSSRIASTPSRGMHYSGAYALYGENYGEAGTTDRNFTGQNQDTVSTGPYPLYDFLLREYHPKWARWLTPDPAAGSIFNPQSLNRYAYVLNSPTTLIDPLGLDDDCTWDRSTSTLTCHIGGSDYTSPIDSMYGHGISYILNSCGWGALPVSPPGDGGTETSRSIGRSRRACALSCALWSSASCGSMATHRTSRKRRR
jgi:RHS repeat-associated protein